jgi:hypothetical protein
MKDGAVEGGHLLGILPWTQWLTWGGGQVMPLFFLVGGFSNDMSSALRRMQGPAMDAETARPSPQPA